MKTKIAVLVLMLVVGLFQGLLNEEQTNAQLLAPLRTGYFTGTARGFDADTGMVLTNGFMRNNYASTEANRTAIWNTSNHAFTLTNKAQFINHILTRYDTGSPRDRTGAAFIIYNIIGRTSPLSGGGYPSRTVSTADRTTFQNIINRGDVSLVLTNYDYETVNSAYMGSITRAERYTTPWINQILPGAPDSAPEPAGTWDCYIVQTNTSSQTRYSCMRNFTYAEVNDDMFYNFDTSLPALSIVHNGTTITKIKINCGNLIGRYRGFTANWNYSLNISNPGNRAPGDTFSINSRMENLSGVYPGDYPILTAADHGHRIWPSTNSAYVTWVSASTGGVLNNSPAKSSLWQNFGPIVPGTGVTRTGTWRVNANTPNNTQICFTTHGSPRSGTPGVSVDWGPMSTSQCFMVYAPAANTWAYDINLNTNVAGTGSNYRTVSRGGLIALNSTVFSVGSVAGATYGHAIRPIDFDSNGVNTQAVRSNLTKESATSGDTGDAASSTWSGLAGLSPGSNRARQVNFRVNSSAANGARFCFHGIVNPSAGPSPLVAREYTSMLCYIVDAPPPPTLTWNYDANVQSGTTSAGNVLPGASVTYVMNGVNSPATASGPSYTQRIVPTGDVTALTNTATTTWIGASLAPGSLTPNRSVIKTVRLDAAPGSRFCLNGNMSPTSGTSTGGVVSITNGTPNWAGERCFTVVRNTYNYVPLTTVSGTIQAGSTITVNGRITNTGSAGTGHPYTERIWANWGGGWLSAGDRTWSGELGLNAGANRTRSTTYTISNNIPHNELICFTTSVNPGTGYATPGTTTNGGGTPTHEYCFRVTRNFYDYNPTINVSGSYKPGSTISITGIIDNNGGTGGVGHPYEERIYVLSGMSQLVSSAETISNQPGLANNASRSRLTTYQIRNDATHNTEICFRISVDPSNGYATPGNTTDAGGPAIADRCINVYNLRFAMTSAISKSGAYVAPGETANFQVFVTNNGDITARNNVAGVYPNAVRGSGSGITCVFSASGSGSGGINGSPACSTSTPGPGADAFNGTVSITVDPNSSPGEEVCLQVSGVFLNGFSDGTERLGGYVSPPTCYVVGVTPYFHAYNGDVWAGGIFDATPQQPIANCGTSPDAIIRSVRSNLSGLWRGSFVEYAAFATGIITDFGTSGSETIPGPANRTTLTFANDEPNLGEYTNDTKCIPNYYELLSNNDSNVTETSNSRNISAFGANSQTLVTPNTGTFTTSGNWNNINNDYTIVINGNLVISSDISYTTNYGSAGSLNVPSLVFVVNGDIFIDQSVGQVDALLISHGEIWTCSNGSNPRTEVAKDICSEQLTINGALIANRINFMRTHEDNSNIGGVHSASSQPAEVINFSPEFYLANPIFRSNLLSEDSFMSVLVKDLPPIY